MRVISKGQFVFAFVTHSLNTFIFIIVLFNFTYQHFFFMSLWSFYINSLYLICTFICDINLYLRKQKYLEQINYVLRNNFSPISISLSIACSILYCLFTLMGEQFLSRSQTLYEHFINIYLHCICTLILIIDMFVSHNKHKQFNMRELKMISFIYCANAIVCCIGKYIFKYNAYAFMTSASFQQLVIASNIIYLFVFNSYQVYVFLVEMKFWLIRYKRKEIICDVEIQTRGY